MSKVANIYKHPATRFLLTFLSLYILYVLIYEMWLVPSGYVDNLLVKHLVKATGKILNIFGYSTFSEANRVGIVESSGIVIGPPCNGISLFALHVGLIIAYPSPWKAKWLLMLGGILMIHVLNLARLVGLAIIAKSNPESLSFHHSYTFTTIIYCLIFLSWYLWIKRLDRANK